MIKAAVYCGTRNLYKDMLPSIKSLLVNSDVDKIYMLIEDDIFPYDLPPECETINVAEQEFFPSTGANYRQKWSYMILMRTVLPWLFPELDRILILDCDTIIKEDISDIWDVDLDDYYLAGVKEPKDYSWTELYICIAVALLNMKKLRDDGMVEKLVRCLNCKRYSFPEQDAFNEMCVGHIKELPPEYGWGVNTVECENPKVEHFAATNGKWTEFSIVKAYGDISLEKIAEIRKEKYGKCVF